MPRSVESLKRARAPHTKTICHISHIAQSFTNVKGELPHELHDKYVHPVDQPDPNLPFDPKMAINRIKRKQEKDKEIEKMSKIIE